MMPFAYPVILGILETLVQMCMKGGSSMLWAARGVEPPAFGSVPKATRLNRRISRGRSEG